MEKKQKGFDFKEHQRIGKELHKLRHRLRTLNGRVLSAYGKSSKATKLTDTILKDLGLLQKELNTRLCEENPSSSKLEILACYYPDGK